MSVSEIKNGTAASSEKDITLYLGDIWRGLVKFWWVGLILAVVCGVGAVFYRTVTHTPQYKSFATFTVYTENSALADDIYSFQYDRSTVAQLEKVFSHVIGSEILSQRVCADLGVATMPASISVSCVNDTNMITLIAVGSEAQSTYNTLLSVIDNYSYITEYIIGPTRLVILTEPQLPDEPTNPLVWYKTILKGGALGLGIAALWIVLYAILRQTVRTKEDVHKDLNRTCVGVLPEVTFKRYTQKINTEILLTNLLLGPEFMESHRLLRESVLNNLKDSEKVILVTSTAQGEGKTVTTVNLAAMLAQKGSRVLVVDGDLRASGIAKMFALDRKGEKPSVLEQTYSIQHIEQLNVDVLSIQADSRHLWKVMRTGKFKEIIDPLRDRYDLILIDTPPCGVISDAVILAGAADVALYVVRQDAVLSTRIREGINTLLSTDIRFMGCVLNGAQHGIGGYGGNYGYGGYKTYHRYGYAQKYAGKYKARTTAKKP